MNNLIKNWKHFIWATSISILAALPLTLAFTFYTVPYLEKRIETAKRDSVQTAVESVYKILNVYANQVKSGKLTVAQAKAQAVEVIKELRYHEKEYFWIHDTNLTMVVHPVKPELNGKTLAEMKDPNGKKIFVEMTDLVNKQSAGFIDYLWPKPGEDKPVPKISYVSLFSDWGWVIGSGVYVDDVRAEILGVRKSNLLVFGFAFLVSTLISLASATRQLHKVVLPVTNAVEALSSNSSGIAETSHQIEEVSTLLKEMDADQSARVQKTAAAMTELNEMIEQTLLNAKVSNKISTETAENVDEGQLVVEKMLTALEDIKESNASIVRAIEDSNNEMSKIGNLVGEISMKTQSINEIVFQTKLLSFNASVEAARAGEHGKGFSVVAQEVGILARRSGESASEISSIINRSQKDVFEIVERNRSRVGQVMIDSKSKLELGLKIASQCKEIFGKVVHGSEENRKMSENIRNASQEQAKGTAEIADALTGMETAAEKNRTLILGTLQQSEELSKRAVDLESLTQSLYQVIGTNEKSQMDNQTNVVFQLKKKSYKKAI